MAITLGSVTLPDGLRWSDEFGWSGVAQATEYTLSGALVVEESAKLSGRPITLVGGQQWAWLALTDLRSLRSLLEAPSSAHLLTLHDGRQFNVMAVRDANTGPVEARPVPLVQDSGPANPPDGYNFIIDRVRLIEVPE